jgi:transcriptional regulator TrmB
MNTIKALAASFMLKAKMPTMKVMPKPCPACLGSGITFSQGGWFQHRSGSAIKCAGCNGKGWLSDEPEPMTATEEETQIVYHILESHSSGLNIDDITRLTQFDIPTVYRILVSLMDEGLVGVKDGSPIVYYSIKIGA